MIIEFTRGEREREIGVWRIPSETMIKVKGKERVHCVFFVVWTMNFRTVATYLRVSRQAFGLDRANIVSFGSVSIAIDRSKAHRLSGKMTEN